MKFFYLLRGALLFFVVSLSFVHGAYSQCASLPPITGLGSNKFPDKLCSPVTADVNYSINFFSATPAGTYELVFIWGDGSPATIVPLASGNTVYSTTQNHPFPADSDCEYQVTMFLRVGGVPCPSTIQTQIISTWRTDEFNGGDVRLISPLTGTRIHEVCEGEDISVIFEDQTDWNCNADFPANYPPNDPVQFPNEQYRWQQIIYNTPIAGAKIPNLTVNSVPVTGDGGVDLLSDYQDTRGVHYLPALVVVNDGDRRNALPIEAPGGFGAGFPVVGDEFQVTIRYWNICNPYDNNVADGNNLNPVSGDLINGDNPPVERTAIIRIIDSPDKPEVNDVLICSGDNPTLTLTNAPTGTIRWYATLSDALTNTAPLQTGNSFSPTAAQAPVGVTDFFVTATAGNNCISDVEQVFVTRRENISAAPPALVLPQLDVCPNTTYTYRLPNDPATETTGGATEFVWSVIPAANATITTGQGTREVTIQTNGTLGAFTLRVIRRYTTAPQCPSNPRNTTITVRANPNPNIMPGSLSLCEGETQAINGNPNNPFGSIASHTWTGTNVNLVLDDVTVQIPNILTTAPAGSYSFTYTVVNSIGCSGSDIIPITITPGISNVDAGPPQDLCFAAPPLITTLAAAIPSAGTGTWSYVSGPDNTPAFSDVNLRTSTVQVDLPGVYVFEWEVVDGSCSRTSTVQIDFGREPNQPTATTPQTFCGLSGTLAGSAPTFETGTWSFVSGPGTVTFDDANSPTAVVTASAFGGPYVLAWTFSSGTCAPKSVNVNVTFNQPGTASVPANFLTCVDQSTLQPIDLSGGSVGGGATDGRWQVVSGSGTMQSSGTTLGGIVTGPGFLDRYIPAAGETSVQVRLVAQDPDGGTGPCGDVNSPTLTISIDRKPDDANAGTDFAVCNGETVTLNADAATNGGQGEWSPSMGVTNINSPTSTVVGITTTTTFTWTVRSLQHGLPGACAASTNDVVVTVRTLPVALDPTPNDLCETNEFTSTAIGVDLTAYNDGVTGIVGSTDRTVHWYATAFDQVNDVNRIITPTDVVNLQVLFTRVIDTSNAESCEALGQVTFTVNPKPEAITQNIGLCEQTPPGTERVDNINLADYEDGATNLAAADRTITWHTSSADAVSASSPVATPGDVDITSDSIFYARIVNNTTSCFNVAQLVLLIKPRPIDQPILGASSPCVNAAELYRVTQISGAQYVWNIPPQFLTLGGGGPNDFYVLLEFPTATSGDVSVTIVLNGCAGNELTKPITVSPDPAGFAIVPPTETICEGGIFQFGVSPDNSGSSNYNWQVFKQSDGSPGGGIVVNGQNTGSALINVLNEDIIVRVTESNASGCAGVPQEVPVAVNLRPIMDNSSVSICSGDVVGVTLAQNAGSPVSATAFDVQVPSVLPGISPITGPTQGTGLAPNAIANDRYRNQTNAQVLSLLYRVTPVSALGCKGEEKSLVVDIKAEPLMDPNLAKTVCSDNAIEVTLKSAIGFFPADKFVVESIVYNPAALTPLTTPPTIGALVDANAIFNDAWENISANDEQVIYNVRPYSTITGCYGNPPAPVVVTIQRKPLVTPLPDLVICSGDILSVPLASPNVANATFVWTSVPDANIVGSTNSVTNTITDQLFNTTLALGSVTYQVRATNPTSSPLCSGPITTFRVDVRASPAITTPLDKVVCSDDYGGTTAVQDLTALNSEVSTVGGVTYTWFTDVNDFGGSQIPLAQVTAYTVTDNVPLFVRVLNPAASSGCAKDATVTFDVRPTPQLAVDPVETIDPRFNITCNGLNNGQVAVSAQFGTNHTFSIDGGGFVPAVLFSNLGAGVHIVRTRNSEGCIDETTVDLLQPDLIVPGAATVADVSCFNDPNPDGQITITATGGTSMSGGDPLQFSLLQDPTSIYDAATQTFSDLRAGTYTVRVEDLNGCTQFVSNIIVDQPDDIALAIDITSDELPGYNGFDVTCAGQNDGQISVLSASGGNGGFTYVLDQDPGNLTGATSGVFDGLSANILYTITATDSRGCQKVSLPEFLIDPIPLFPGVVGFDKDICEGADPTAFTQLAPPFGGIGNYTYLWQESDDNTTFGPAAGVNNDVLFDPPVLADTMYYRRVVSSGSCAPVITDVVKVIVHPLPVATLTAPAQVCEGGFFTLNFGFTTGQAPYFFDYTDGTTTFSLVGAEQRPVPVINYTATTTYTLTHLRDFYGCEPVAYPPSVTPNMINMNTDFTIVPTTPQCSGGVFTMEWTVNPNVEYVWSWNDGTPDRIIPASGAAVHSDTVQHRFTSANVGGSTILPVTLTARSTIDATCFKQSPAHNVTINPAIFINLTADKNEICSGETVKFINTTLGGSTHHWFYRIQGGVTEISPRTFTTPSSQDYTFRNTTEQDPMIYELVYQVSNGTVGNTDYCFDEVIIPITVYREMDADFNLTSLTEYTGGNAIATFDNVSSPLEAANFEYEWDFGAGAVPATLPDQIAPPQVRYTSIGQKDIRLTVTNKLAEANGLNCYADTTKTIFVVLPPLFADFRYTPQAACFPADITITQNLATGDLYEWTLRNDAGRILLVSNDTLPTFKIVNPGVYNIHLKTTNSITGQFAKDSTDATPIEIFAPPFAVFETRPETVFVPDDDGMQMYNRTSGASSYFWDFDDGENSTEFEPIHFYQLTGKYLITLVASFNHGPKDFDGDGVINGELVCYDTTQVEILAKEGGLVKIPNAFTPDPSGPSDGGVQGATGINDVFLPVMKGVEEFEMQVFDRWGTLIFESKKKNQGWDGYDKNGNLLPAGVYVYKLTLRLSNNQRTTQVGDITLIR